ncbi:MAG: T9SS type A sorting domain-containing protein, partial [candidate division Zixibacteria bacterium]|nr:T9SS type A sorting domain-containing protein [candidate division Zixibacteria bacterium]MCP4580392.1 T9SS type A sorting domain-containing protein [candidate division Zixibacteria bacterium]
TSDVNLTVFNMLGQEVATLVSEKLEAGHHSVNWNAAQVSSGVYFYKLTAGDKTETHAMTLIK